MPHPPDTLCYFRHPEESWLWGKVKSYDPSKKKYTCYEWAHEGDPEGEAVAVPEDEDNFFIVREDIVYSNEYEETHDLLRLTILHDSTLLNCVKTRYFKDIIYTFIGAIVVAVNPFNFKIPWYMDDQMEKYLEEGYPIQNNLPHSWACAHNTYHELRDMEMNQTILVSGESGAGKTEASKIVLKYLAAISARIAPASGKEGVQDVRAKIMAASPFLEAFGNAKTSRNDNSSRFGKFMQIKFTESGSICGANITKYLLEKSRIVTAGPGERVYHSFYLAVRGSGHRPVAAPGIGDDTAFRSLNSGGCLHNKEFDTLEEFDEVVLAMQLVGIEEGSLKGIWAALGGVLHMLNIVFEQEGEGSRVASSSQKSLEEACNLWGVDAGMVGLELIRTVIQVRGDRSDRKLSVSKATDGRDALVKRIYDQVFSWLVVRCNDTLDTPTYNGWIGLLDIFGFEHFEVNSFEQLCINIANEALQGNYNEHIFRRDMAECRAEGVDVTEVTFPDNTPCIDLVLKSKPPGIFALLDSASALSKGDPAEDTKWLQQISTEYAKHPFFEKKRLSRDSFIVKHYAGDVSYLVNGFVDKNADTLKDAWRDVVASSSSEYMRGLCWQVEKRLTVAGFFKQQLADLMAIINASNPHWIRCVKPHPAKRPKMFQGNQVAFQLTTSGVLATVKIRKAGYPVRLTFQDFAKRYRVLFWRSRPPDDIRERAKSLLDICGYDKKRAQMGNCRVFLKQDAYVELEERKRECTGQVARLCQMHVREKLTKLFVWRPGLWEFSSRVMQREIRMFLDRSRDERRRRANLRQLHEVECAELLRRCEYSYDEANELLHWEEQIGRYTCWVLKLQEETLAATSGLLGDEERWRQWIASEEGAARGEYHRQLQWCFDHKEELEVVLREEVRRREVAREIHEEWLGLLRVWIPMQLFELEFGRGLSERVQRRRIVDEEIAARRSLSGLEVEHHLTASLSQCSSDESRHRKDVEYHEASSWRLLIREKIEVDRNVLLSVYLNLSRGEGVDESGRTSHQGEEREEPPPSVPWWQAKGDTASDSSFTSDHPQPPDPDHPRWWQEGTAVDPQHPSLSVSPSPSFGGHTVPTSPTARLSHTVKRNLAALTTSALDTTSSPSPSPSVGSNPWAPAWCNPSPLEATAFHGDDGRPGSPLTGTVRWCPRGDEPLPSVNGSPAGSPRGTPTVASPRGTPPVDWTVHHHAATFSQPPRNWWSSKESVDELTSSRASSPSVAGASDSGEFSAISISAAKKLAMTMLPQSSGGSASSSFRTSHAYSYRSR